MTNEPKPLSECKPLKKDYLGDGVYVSFDGFQLHLTTENGIAQTNSIFLETEVYGALLRYVERIREARN